MVQTIEDKRIKNQEKTIKTQLIFSIFVGDVKKEVTFKIKEAHDVYQQTALAEALLINLHPDEIWKV